MQTERKALWLCKLSALSDTERMALEKAERARAQCFSYCTMRRLVRRHEAGVLQQGRARSCPGRLLLLDEDAVELARIAARAREPLLVLLLDGPATPLAALELRPLRAACRGLLPPC